MTDHAGGYLIATLENVVIRRAGADHEPVAPSRSAWFWDRVAAFGGCDPRSLAPQDVAEAGESGHR